MPRQNTRFESEGAEFLVLGHLLIRGIPSYKTYTNVPGYDLVATSPDSKRIATIQVKSRWAKDAPHFLIKNAEDSDFVVLVRLNRGPRGPSADKAKQPEQDAEFYVLPASEAKARLVDADTDWPKIRWREADLSDFRGRCDLVERVLGMTTGPEQPEAE